MKFKNYKILAIIPILIILLFIFINLINSNNKITVGNFDNFSKNISQTRKDSINIFLQEVSKKTGKNNLKKGDALIRDKSYKEFFDDKSNIYSSNFIIDIKKSEQSFKTYITWSNNPKVKIEQDTLKFDCLIGNEVIYPNFNCHDVLGIEKGLNDTIINLLPQSSFNYKITLGKNNGNKIGLNISIFIYTSDLINGDNKQAIEKYKKQATDWIISKGLNIDNYNITYKIY